MNISVLQFIKTYVFILIKLFLDNSLLSIYSYKIVFR